MDTVRRFQDHYRLHDDAVVLDVGCAKGFMMHDFKVLMPKMTIAGLDISKYAYEHALEDVKPFIKVGTAKNLPYPDKSFDLVISINTVHNLPLEGCTRAMLRGTRKANTHEQRTLRRVPDLPASREASPGRPAHGRVLGLDRQISGRLARTEKPPSP